MKTPKEARLIFLVAFPLVLASAAIPAPAAAGDAEAGRRRAISCAGCHGVDGIGLRKLYPNLAGQKEDYLAKALKDFRDGARRDPKMSDAARGLSDADIEDLAAYYSVLHGAAQ